MIMFFNEKINNFNEKSLKSFSSYKEKSSYVQSLMPDITNLHQQSCPCCYAKNQLIKYGTYQRNISILVDENIENYRVSVQRIMCKSCGHTHALLPNFVVPYKIMALFSITQIVQKATISSVCKLSEIINLSITMIYTYIALVLAFFNDFKIFNNSQKNTYIKNFNEKYFLTNCINLSNFDFRLKFFEFYNWYLFMQKFRNNSSPPVNIFVFEMPPT